MCVQGIPMHQIVESATDSTIMGGNALKQVTKLRKDFKPPDQPRTHPCMLK